MEPNWYDLAKWIDFPSEANSLWARNPFQLLKINFIRSENKYNTIINSNKFKFYLYN